MKVPYIIISIILAITLMFRLASCENKATKKIEDTYTGPELTKPKDHQVEDEAFEGLRNMAFSSTTEQLGLSFPTDKTIVYGVVMDWGINGVVATTVAYQTGDASFYLSSGGGVIGGGQNQNVNSAAKQFVKSAQAFLDLTNKTETTSLPEDDVIKFYFLTNNGIYAGQESMSNFKSNNSPWLQLFKDGNDVLTELRLTSEK